MAGRDDYNAWLVDRARPVAPRPRPRCRRRDRHAHRPTPRRSRDEVVALEPEPEFAAMLRDSGRRRRRSSKATRRVEGPFDAIVCFNVLEHIADDEGTLRRFRELLAPGGALLPLVPAHPALYGTLDRAFGHERRYAKARAAAQARAAPGSQSSGFATSIRSARSAGWSRREILRRAHIPPSGSTSTTGSSRAARARPPAAPLRALALGGREDDRHREREREERVEVIELHRQIEEVRGERAGERSGAAPRERPHARSERIARRRERPAERPRGAQPPEDPEEEEPEERGPHEPVSTISETKNECGPQFVFPVTNS